MLICTRESWKEVKQGIDEGSFKAEYPFEVSEIIIAGVHFIRWLMPGSIHAGHSLSRGFRGINAAKQFDL